MLRTIRSGEVTLSFLDIQGASAEQKNWNETQIANNGRKMGEIFCDWEQIGELETDYWEF